MESDRSHDPETDPFGIAKLIEKAHYHLTGDEFEAAGVEYTLIAESYDDTPANREKIKHAFTMAAISYAHAGMDGPAQNRINLAQRYYDDQEDLKELRKLHAEIFKLNYRPPEVD